MSWAGQQNDIAGRIGQLSKFGRSFSPAGCSGTVNFVAGIFMSTFTHHDSEFVFHQ